MKKFSLKATMAESNHEAAIQLMFVIILSLWAKEVTRLGLMSMLSSAIMIGKSSAENYLTFGSKNLLEDAPIQQQLLLLARTSPVFVLTAIFRVGSFGLIVAWDYVLATFCILPIAAATVFLFLIFLKVRCNHLRDLTLGNMFKSYVNYTSFLIQIIISPNGHWFNWSPTYHPDPKILQICGIFSLCSGWSAFGLQILLQRGHIL